MSPEQAKGFEADQRSDIFSFGCILYEMLTGCQAFAGDTVSEILASVLKSDVDWTRLPARLNPRLVEVLQRCLEKSPKQRWHAAADVRLEIEALAGQAVVAADNPPVMLPAFAPRPIWRSAIGAALFTAGGALIAGYAAWLLKPEPPRGVTRFSIALPDGQQFTNPGRLMLALSPDGQTLAYIANQRIFLRPLSGLASHELVGSESQTGLSNLVFSPDGQWIAFRWNADNSIKRLPITGGAPVTICQLDRAFSGLTWNEQGLVFAQPGKGIMRVSPSGGVPEVVATIDADEVADAPQILPDGETLLYSVMKGSDTWDKGQVVVQPLKGGQRTTILNGGADARYVPSGHLAYAVSGVLYAMPFDVRALSATGSSVSVVEGVRRAGGGSANFSAIAHYAFAPNGSFAYVPGPTAQVGGLDLAIFDRRNLPQPLNLPPATYSAPRVSPDGKWVAFEISDERAANVLLYDLSGTSAIRRLTFGGSNRAPVWSPDSAWIAYQSDREGDVAIFRQRADGSGAAERLTKPDQGTGHVPESWSPDGEHLLFTALSRGRFSSVEFYVHRSPLGAVQRSGVDDSRPRVVRARRPLARLPGVRLDQKCGGLIR